MSRVAFPITTFTDLGGHPLGNGFILIQLNTDAKTPDPAQIGAGSVARVALDTNGVIVGSPTFWPNAQLLPVGTVYLLNTFTSEGQEVIENQPVTV